MRSPTDNLPNDAERSGIDEESDATMVLGSHGALDRFAVSAPETWPTPASPAGGETGRGAVPPAAAGRRATGESATAEEACDPSIEQYVADLIARGNKQRPLARTGAPPGGGRRGRGDAIAAAGGEAGSARGAEAGPPADGEAGA